MNCLTAFLKNERGSTAIEYSLIAGLVCIVIIAGITSVGSETEGTYDYVKTSVGDAIKK